MGVRSGNVTRRRLVGVVMLSAVGAVCAHADLVPIGEPIPGNSWSHGMLIDGIGPFDLVAGHMTAGEFDLPGQSGFSEPGWTDTFNSAEFSIAAGPSVESMSWFLGFEGDSADPLSLDLAFFNGQDIAFTFNMVWDGVGPWIIQEGSWRPGRDTLPHMPAPSSTLLAGLGLTALAGMWRRL